VNLKDLTKDMPHKYRVQQAKQYGANCVAYIDSRDVQDLLDKVIGPDKWQDKYYEVKGNMFCSIGILCGETWVWKTDCGTESNVDKQKGEASDAFKRAAVKWGVGRFLYSLPMPKLNTTTYKDSKDGQGRPKYYPVDANGNIIWDKDVLSTYCMSLNGKSPPKTKQPPKQPTKALPLASMTEQEQTAMTSVFLIAMVNKPDGMDDKLFKFQAATKLYDKMKHWPITQQEQEEAIAILDKEYKK
jgi:hypothetical protein